MYADIIDRCLTQSIRNPDQQTSICAASTTASQRPGSTSSPVMTSRDTRALDFEHDTGHDSDHEDEQEKEVCAHCNRVVTHGIACDNCDQWNHFECESLDKKFHRVL